MTVTAANVHGIWTNSTFSPAASPVEFHSIDALPAATLSAFYVLRTVRSKNVVGAEALTTSIKPVSFDSVPTLPQIEYATRIDGERSAESQLSAIATAFQDIIPVEMYRKESRSQTDANIETASTMCCSPSPADFDVERAPASVAAVDLPGGSIVFLNTTSPNYMLIDYANATVVVWSVPASTTTTHATHLRQVVDKINSCLPYIEAFGILTLAWKVVEYIYGKIRSRRSSRGQAEVSDGSL